MAAASLLWQQTPWVNINSPYGNADWQAAFRTAIGLTDAWEVDDSLDDADATVGNVTAVKQSGGSPRQPNMRIFVGGIRSGTTAPAQRALTVLTADIATVDTNGYNWITCSPDCAGDYTLSTWKTSLIGSGVQTGFRPVCARNLPSGGLSRVKMYIAWNEEGFLVVTQGSSGQAYNSSFHAGAAVECLDAAIKWPGDVLYTVGGTLNINMATHLLAGSTYTANPWFGAASSSYGGGSFIDKNGTQGTIAFHPYAGYSSTDHAVGVDSWLVEGGIRLDNLEMKDASRTDYRRIGRLRQVHPWGGALLRSILLDEDNTTHRGYFVSAQEGVVSPAVLLYNPAA